MVAATNPPAKDDGASLRAPTYKLMLPALGRAAWSRLPRGSPRGGPLEKLGRTSLQDGVEECAEVGALDGQGADGLDGPQAERGAVEGGHQGDQPIRERAHVGEVAVRGSCYVHPVDGTPGVGEKLVEDGSSPKWISASISMVGRTTRRPSSLVARLTSSDSPRPAKR